MFDIVRLDGTQIRRLSQKASVRTVTFTARVRARQPLTAYDGRAIPTHFDPGYVLVVSVNDNGTGDTSIPARGRVAFAIHSPTYVFARVGEAEEQIGQAVRFRVEKTIGPDGASWSRLEAWP